MSKRVPQRCPTWILAGDAAGSLVRRTAYIVLCPCSETMGSQTNGAETFVPAMISTTEQGLHQGPLEPNPSGPLENNAFSDPGAFQGPSRDLQGALRTLWEPLGISREPPGIPQGPSRDLQAPTREPHKPRGSLQGPSRDPPGTSREIPGTGAETFVPAMI